MRISALARSRPPGARHLLPAGGAFVLLVLLQACAGLPRTASERDLAPAYEEAFASESRGWRDDASGLWAVEGGRYVARSTGDLSSVSLYVDKVWDAAACSVALSRGSAGDSSAGLLLRASPDFRSWEKGDAYVFAVGFSGGARHAAVFRQVGGQVDYLFPWTETEALKADPATNVLSAQAIGPRLEFRINGNTVWRGDDGSIATGHVGLTSVSVADQGAEHRFGLLQVMAVPPVAAAPSNKPSASRSTPQAAEAPASADPSGIGVPVPLDATGTPLLRPGLMLRVTVLVSGKREVDGEVVRVSDQGRMDLPLVGSVQVQGVTLAELTKTLEARYQDFFISPQVVADFVLEDRPDAISPWGSVVVLGRVRTPGRVNIPPTQDLTVSAAIQQVGGLDTSAKDTAIRVTRRDAEGKIERFIVDFTSIGSRGRAENDLLLKSGDLIFVPERVF